MKKGLLPKLLLVLFALAVAAGFVFLRDKNETDSSKKQDAVATYKTSPKAEYNEDAVLAKKITDWAVNNNGAVMVRELEGKKRTASVNADKQMIPASTYKLFLTYAILQQVQDGKFTLSSKLSDGTTIKGCIDPLISISSDACAWRLGNLIGWDNVDAFLQEKGYKDTKINNYTADGDFEGSKQSSVQDETDLLTRLAKGELLNKELTDYLVGLMKDQVLRERIPAGVPSDVEVADKPGFLKPEAVENDAGIVYAPSGKYVIVIFSTNTQPSDLADLSQTVYEHLTASQ